MSEHVEKLRTVEAVLCNDASQFDPEFHDQGLIVRRAADHLERCEKLLAAYYAANNDPKFGPCDCEICTAVREMSEK